ncbi:hypothetical protein Q5P01_008341 [Channa striata]|uniref:Uncharacterized protein n=1 Tax=Channa striata TaxID=64152 RepID=A0AA88N5T8_CHASR|nr:hypothetical protein Q5P01_008341 [Channa striata]
MAFNRPPRWQQLQVQDHDYAGVFIGPPPRPIPPVREPVIRVWLRAERPERGGGDADHQVIISQPAFAPAFDAAPAAHPPAAPAPRVIPPVQPFAAPPAVPPLAAPAPPVAPSDSPAPLVVPPFAAPGAAAPAPPVIHFAGPNANATPPALEEPEEPEVVPTTSGLSFSVRRSREESDEEASAAKRLRWCDDSDSD